jgi:transposase
LRAKIVLKLLDGVKKKHIAEQLGTSRPTVSLWIKRYESGGVEAILRDAPRPGLKPKVTEENEKEIVEARLHIYLFIRRYVESGYWRKSCLQIKEKR